MKGMTLIIAQNAISGSVQYAQIRSVFIVVKDQQNQLENNISKIMKYTFILIGSMAIFINACSSSKDPELSKKILEIAIDDAEDLIEYKTGVDIDLNQNGK